MSITATPRPIPRSTAPASWLVTDGQLVVGPVTTDLLLRGITHMRIPPDALVKQPGWPEWRSVRNIREAARPQTPPRPEPSTLLSAATDFGELILLGLHDAVERTWAGVGVAYRDREPHIGFVASAVHGLSPDLLLGLALKHHDPAMEGARDGRFLIGGPSASATHRVVADRLGGAGVVRGVLVVPIRWQERLIATLELGRFDHEFRAADLGAAEEVSRAIGARVQETFEQRRTAT